MRFHLLLLAALAFTTFAIAENPFALPASEEGLPGEGNLRRYEGYVKRWPVFVGPGRRR